MQTQVALKPGCGLLALGPRRAGPAPRRACGVAGEPMAHCPCHQAPRRRQWATPGRPTSHSAPAANWRRSARCLTPGRRACPPAVRAKAGKPAADAPAPPTPSDIPAYFQPAPAVRC